MSYLLLFSAIGCEIFATTCMKYSDGFTKLLPSALSIIGYIGCYILFSRAIMHINLAASYATWCGVGIAATAVISWLIFGEKLNLVGILSLVLIIAGVILLNVFGIAAK